jgi:hypothetical protein
MRRLLKGAPGGGRVCQRGVRCKRCKGGSVPGVSQSAEVRGRVRAETPGRLCSSASRRRGEPGLQRAGGDRRCSKERGWIMASPNKEIRKEANEECTTVPRKKGARCAACRQGHRSEEQCAEGACAARSKPCEACRTGRRSAAEFAVRHPQVFAALQSSRGREAADVARSGGQPMPTRLIQTVPDSAQRGER